jgi:hypothetical protein
VATFDKNHGTKVAARFERAAGLVAATIAALLAPAAQPSARATIATQTFVPVADSYVISSKPATSFGTAKQPRVDGSPETRSYIRFNVQSVGATVKSATLQLNSAITTSVGFDVHAVANNTWGETTVTYTNAPGCAAPVTASSGGLTSGQWVSLDVTPLVSGNGLVSLALTSTSAAVISLASREAGSKPQLVLVSTNDVAATNTAPPTIAGTPQDGLTLTAYPGTWTGTQPLSFAYQWRRCDAGANACSDITNATNQTYVATATDVTSTLGVVVTASNDLFVGDIGAVGCGLCRAAQ